MEKQLLFEAFALSGVEYIQDKKIIVEALKNKKGARMVIKLPVGFTDRPTGNGRLYEKKEVVAAFKKSKELMETGATHGQNGRHPDTFNVDPDNLSHLITEGWVDKDGTIWNKWVVLKTSNGNDLAEAFLGGARIGVSIRGRGVEHKETSGKYPEAPRIREYDFGGTDTVGFPSTKMYSGMTVPKVEVDILENDEAIAMCKNLIEMHEQEDCSLKDTPESKGDQKSEEKMEEVKGKTKYQTIMEKLDTMSLDINTLQESKPVKNELKESADNTKLELEGLKEEVTKMQEAYEGDIEDSKSLVNKLEAQASGMEEKIDKMSIKENAQKVYTDKVESVVEALKEKFDVLVELAESLRKYAFDTEDVVEALVEANQDTVNIAEALRKHSTIVLEARKKFEAEIVALNDDKSKLEEELKSAKEGLDTQETTPDKIRNTIGYLIRQNPKLQNFKKELEDSKTVEECRNRALKYTTFIEGSNISHKTEENIGKVIEKHQGTFRGWK